MSAAIKGTQNRRILAQINDLLEGKGVRKMCNTYQINGRALNRMPVNDLLRLQAEYTRRCLNETQSGDPFGQVTFRG